MLFQSDGPIAQNMLEPPGFLALHYGVPDAARDIDVAPVFGAILGGFYRLK
jgi:hypothetical protein